MAKKNLSVACSISMALIAMVFYPAVAKPGHSSLPRNPRANGASQAPQRTFATPKEAADALVEAAASFDAPVLKEILGPGSEDLVASEDTVQDKNRAAEFVAKAREQTSVKIDPKNP